jgi:hypothetical protein
MEMESPLFCLDLPVGERNLSADYNDEDTFRTVAFRATVRKSPWSADSDEELASRPISSSLSPQGRPSAFGSSPNDVTAGIQFTVPKSAAPTSGAKSEPRLQSLHSTEMREIRYLEMLESVSTNVSPFFLLQDPPRPTNQVHSSSVSSVASATILKTWLLALGRSFSPNS